MSGSHGEMAPDGGRSRGELVEALSRMAPGLVHELRNPLSGVLAGSEMLGRHLPSGGPGRDYWEIVREEAKQLEGFLAQLAEFGRLATARLPGSGQVELEELARLVCDELREEAAAGGVALEWQTTGVSVVQGDSAWLSRAIREVARNGLLACSRGGRVSVRVAPGEIPSESELRIEDNGRGMSPEECAQAREPFFSLRPRALGLGLPLVEAILRAHRGSLRLESREGQGTRARIRLPLADGAGPTRPPRRMDSP